ncbi:MAG: hypothetical protein FIB07_08640 [Candidatus Methanoperedens sp.]|nr:hypothetical protein [Candidatus Methanoperedens sp.]
MASSNGFSLEISINKEYKTVFQPVKSCIILISVLIILLMSSVASAAVYRWVPGSGVEIATGITTDWGPCGTNPLTNRTTLLTDNPASGCGSNSITSDIADPIGETYPLVEMFFNTAYSRDTNVTGDWYFGRIHHAGITPTTYTFYLIYALPDGTKITLPGTGSLTISSSSDQNYNVSLAQINGVVPKDAKLGLKITKSVQWARYLWFGDMAANGGVASGYFSVTETLPGEQKYSLSGYITSGGAPIEGVSVRANTGQSDTTDSQGYYLLTELPNGSYVIDASLPGYVPTSTNATINGANRINVNISLSQEPKYLLSGYVKDQSTGDAIADALVTTDTDMFTNTSVTGYYSFLLNNGTYLITASKSGYYDAFVERTVNGVPGNNSNISITSRLPVVSKILVATNRYVILDDPIDNSKTAQTSANFSLPPNTGWSTSNNQWSGTQTQIKGFALLVDTKGNPVNNTNVTFTLSNWNNATSETSPVITTDANGIANYTFDMNARNYYGNWNIIVNASGKSESSGFIYNWWGCNSGTGCNQNHGTDSPGTGSSSIQNSPYTLGRETITYNSNHRTISNIQSNNNCVGCHRSYGGTGGGTSFTGQPTKTSDVHTTDTCSSCHSLISTHNSNSQIKSCTDCHTRTDLSKKGTMAGSPLRSNYSVASSGHNPNSTIPCIICHGPMHNISKPDKTQKLIRNNDTESSQCIICHASYTTHNASNSGGLNCTLCHSDDIHAIQVLGQDGSYVTYNKANPNNASGNCTNCHQNTTYFNTLKSQPKAGNYSGRNPSFIRNPQLHSDALDAGIRYGNYWWMQNQDASCRYCHGKTMHDSVAIGTPSLFKGNNIINSTIADTTWCASCHYPGYVEYSNMTAAFIKSGANVPPSIIKGSNYYVKGRDHSVDPGFNDSNCYTCHNGSTPYTKITPFMHEVYIGGGGPDCLSCHEIGSAGSVLHVNNSAMKLSFHSNLNNNSVNLYGVSAENKKCWGCHQTDGIQPGNTSMGDRFSSPYTCYDCHKNDGKPYPNVENAGSVTNHIDVDSIITRIYTHNATCTTCHNNSVNLNDAKITDPRIVSEKESVSHYGSKQSLVESIGDSSTQGCTYCHYNTTNRAKWGNAHDPRLNPVKPHTATKNDQCYICHIQGELPADFHSESMYYAGNGKIVLATNRYVILDDPNPGKAETTAGFSTPRNNWNSNYWSGKNTRINATALFIDRHGIPQSGSIISFTIYWPNGTALATINSSTNPNGLANFSYDMNNRNYYGNWKIEASSGSVKANITFMYNWWGCSVCHGSENPGSGTPSLANSPYLSGRDVITNREFDHRDSSVKCTYCHSSYDGVPGGAAFTTRKNNPSDVHRNLSCNNANCHGSFSQHGTNQRINSCYNAACHNRTDITRKGTLNGVNLDTALSIYSYDNASSFNSTFHTPNSTVPCMICHGPMHSITKADPAQRFIKNNDTEYNNCIACHQDQVRHNNSVNCPVCHSDDVHAIKVLAQNATYVTLDHNNPNPARGNCTNCHQNSSFFNILMSQPTAGNYTGRQSPVIRTPVEHSEDTRAGNIWTDEGYWIHNDQVSWCAYCHNNEMHAISTLGKIKMFNGDNIVNSTIGNTTWCASCHWQGYSNDSTKYIDMVDTFTGYLLPVPPEITGHALYAPTGKPGYFNHTLSTYSDQDCKSCHSTLGPGAKITEFTHNVRKGQSGGRNCTSCHYEGSPTAPNVDIVNMGLGAHASLNNFSQYTGGNITNRKCWACHGTLNANGFANESDQPVDSHNISIYKNPRGCPGCHNNNQINSNLRAPQVAEHRERSPVIPTNGTGCSLCHNNSLTTINENDGFGISGGNAQNATASHYLKDANINLMTATNHSNDCRWCHILNNGSTNWGTPFNPKNSTKYTHSDENVAQNSNCYACHGSLSSSVRLHDSGITGGAQGAPNCLSCHYAGSQYPNIDINAAGISVHSGMNSYNATSKGYAPIVGACWACHDSDGNVTSGHPDKKDTPKVCDDCHVQGGAYYSQSAGWGGLTVNEHFRGGTDIKAGNASSNIASCINCHENVSEMILNNDDPDTGSFAGDGMRLNGGNRSYYHYGRPRTDLRGVDIYLNPIANCIYCHRNDTTAFEGAMLDPDQNKYVNEHSDEPNNPSCSSDSCHSKGWIHNSTMTKPVINNNAYCGEGCHSTKTSHNRTDFYCWYCHQDPSNPNKTNQKAPHGMMYPKTDGSFLMYNRSASNANCTTCHIDDLVNTTLKPVKIPSLSHSTDPDSGKKWGNYWDNTSKLTACQYCHQSSLHSYQDSLIGNISSIKGTNTYKNPDFANSTWCANCHYAGEPEYKGNLLNPVPPEITNSSLVGSDGTVFYNHSGFSNYNDSKCRVCHALSGSYLATSMNYSHNLGEGSMGGVNCTSCHNTGGIAGRKIDAVSMDSSYHANLNNRSQYTGGNMSNRKCWACHGTLNADGYANESDQPAGEHNNTMFKNPRKCPDCHDNTQSSSNFGALQVVEHQSSSPDVITAGVKCSICHNNSLASMNEPDGFGINGGDPQNASVSHYGTKTALISTQNCILCHNGQYTGNFSWGTPVNISTSPKMPHIQNQTSECDLCHNDGTVSSLALVDFHNSSIKEGSADSCIACHDVSSTSSAKTRIDSAAIGMHRNLNRTDGNNNLTNSDCETCHYNTDNMNATYKVLPGVNVLLCNECHLGQNSSRKVNEHYPGANINVTTMNCENCHSNSLNIPDSNSTVNTTMGNVTHYGTTANLVTPSAGVYNTACNNCHNSAANKSSYGVVNKQVTVSHTGAGTCEKCHIDGSASDLHNSSLAMPVTVSCKSCHTTYASKYNASNLTNTAMGGSGYTTCGGGSCHGTDISGSLDTLARHNVDRTYPGTGGSTNTVYLNNNVSLSVTKGTPVEITSMINDANGAASRVGGAEYYIDTDPGQGKGIPMTAADGLYDARQGSWESVIATLDTGSLPDGNHTIYVRGVDIGKQWSTPKNATLVVQSLGYINVTVTSVDGPVVNADVWIDSADIKKTDINGSYLFAVPAGTYSVTVSKQPTHNDNTSTGVVVTQGNTTSVQVYLQKKPTGIISGTITNV